MGCGPDRCGVADPGRFKGVSTCNRFESETADRGHNRKGVFGPTMKRTEEENRRRKQKRRTEEENRSTLDAVNF